MLVSSLAHRKKVWRTVLGIPQGHGVPHLYSQVVSKIENCRAHPAFVVQLKHLFSILFVLKCKCVHGSYAQVAASSDQTLTRYCA